MMRRRQQQQVQVQVQVQVQLKQQQCLLVLIVIMTMLSSNMAFADFSSLKHQSLMKPYSQSKSQSSLSFISSSKNRMMMISPGGDNSDDTTAAADTDTLDDEEQAKPVTGTGTATGTTLPSPPQLEQQQQQQQQQHYQQHMGPKAKSPPGLLRSLFPTLPWHRLPNLLTYLRCLSIPLFIATFYQDRPVTSSVIFALSSITDWLDGYLARRWDIASDFGAFLDPVADKLMVSTALILLTGKQLVLQFAAAAAETATTALKITNHHNILIAIPTSIILAREIAVSALREWMAQRNQRNAVKVGWQGKLKTATTMVAITILLLSTSTEPTASPLFLSGMALLYVSMILTVTSGSVYFRAAAPVLLGK